MSLDRLLITGAAGDIGTALRPALRSKYQLRLGDLMPIVPLRQGEEAVVADIRDLSAMEEAASGMDAITPRLDKRASSRPEITSTVTPVRALT